MGSRPLLHLDKSRQKITEQQMEISRALFKHLPRMSDLVRERCLQGDGCRSMVGLWETGTRQTSAYPVFLQTELCQREQQ